MALPAPVLALRQVTKRFPGVLANDRLDLDIRAGEVLGLLGENGAGKSTLIGMLSGMQRPDAGDILLDGQPVRLDSPARALACGIGTVFQHRMLVPELTVAESLLLGRPWWQRPRRHAIRTRLAAVCADLGVQLDPDAVVGDLPLGAQQTVEIIRAVWRDSRVVVLDEPTAMLDPQGAAELGRIMRGLAARGVAVVFVTHHLDEALAYADRIVVLRRGRVAGELAAAEWRALPAAEATRAIVAMMFGAAVADTPAAPVTVHDAAAPRVLTVTGLTVRDRVGRALVDDVAFSVQAGEVFGIAGVDGNGQAALAHALAGQIAASGRVSLDGADLSGIGVAGRTQRGLRLVTDDRLGEGVVGALPVSINLLLKQIGAPPFWSHGRIRTDAVDRHADALIAAFDIRTPGPGTPIGTLSGGNIQKALLARELDGAPRLVIYHKPTHGLDVRTAQATHQRIRDAAAAGLAAILISNDLDEVLALSARVGVMRRGRLAGIVANGPDARPALGRLMAGA